jgi:integrase
MPQPARGELRPENDDGTFSTRITVGHDERVTYQLDPTIRDREAAEARSTLLAGIAQRFRKAGKTNVPEVRKLLTMVAEAPGERVNSYIVAAEQILSGKVRQNTVLPTFEEFAGRWTSGELASKYPDHIKAKKTSGIDAQRIKKICAIPYGFTTLGSLPINEFGLDAAQAAMAALPADAKTAATRRHYAQIVHKVLAMAVFPCRLLAVHPLPKGFLPKVGKPPRYPYLVPREEAALMAHTDTPIEWRLFFGFLSREGCRPEEGYSFQVRDFDLDVGNVMLDANKTDDPRSWALNPGVVKALRAWVAMRGAKPSDFMFTDPNGGPLTPGHRPAELLRGALMAAGVDRHELHHDGTNRKALRARDTRSTFVTLSLANGQTETWVADRTGHASSTMINRYRKRAREAQELHLGELVPLCDAIPEIRELLSKSPQLVSRDGIEPPTRGFSILCSTD